MAPLTRTWSDRQLWAALVAGPLFWFLLYLCVRPDIALDWPLRAPWAFASLVLLYPALEEIVFRGLLQGWLLRKLPGRRIGPVSVANGLTSVAFCIPHFIFRHPFWAAGVFVPSLVFGHFRERHGTLRTPIVLHVWYNLGYFWLFTPL